MGHSPDWAPDGGHLAFLQNNQGKNELWLCDAQFGNVRCLVPGVDVKQFVWSPDSQFIAWTARCQAIDAVFNRVTRLRYKLDGEGFTHGYTHVFLVAVQTGKVTKVSMARSDHGCITFHPQSGELAFVSHYLDGEDTQKVPYLHRYDVKTGKVRSMPLPVKSVTELHFAASGKLYGAGKRDMETSVEFDKLFEIGNETKWVTDALDMAIGCHVISDARRPGFNPVLSVLPDGKIITIGTTQGRQRLLCVDVERGQVELLDFDGSIQSFTPIESTAAGCKVAVVADSFRHPAELSIVDWVYGGPCAVRNVTDINEAYTLALPPLHVSEHWWTTADSINIQGWVLRRTPEAGRVRGTVLVIHGGPHMAFGDAYHMDFHYLCGLGYQVVICNPRGSYGYGQTFSSAILGEWGRQDVGDLLGFYEHACGGDMDGENTFVMGGSYGGYLVNWLISHDDRFRGAISERSICNLYSKIGNSDLGFLINRVELGGADLWEDESFIMERSPIRYARNVHTPLLLMHGEADHRCPVEQSEQWFTALKRLGKEVDYVRFPGASHAMASQGRPRQRAARLRLIAKWLRSHSEGEGH
ncbi:S9 family peptidase [Alicyclobacillus cycloheptanicus]|uniref:S9 family peptidase n=1 Tax=Alicyclobacillus cycloheptanicus TaxID=1457 RepID=UPI00237891B7|nr:S9 family peptidase [Alicyclobacillus cycloheptanicus]WDM02207.1 S9 family peptidase [Alicyclobacillus cycloheptanicus]